MFQKAWGESIALRHPLRDRFALARELKRRRAHE
jgi:hypothetical protein